MPQRSPFILFRFATGLLHGASLAVLTESLFCESLYEMADMWVHGVDIEVPS